MAENNHQLVGQQTRGETATLMHILEKPYHSTSNGHNFRRTTPNGLKSFWLERSDS
jgi:hypothetical protein